MHGGALGPFEQISHFAGGHIVGGLAIDGHDDVARTDSGPVRGCPGERRNHNDLVVTRAYLHTYAVVTAALLFLQSRVLLWVEKVRVGIEHAQHAGNGTVVDRLVGVHFFRIVLLDDAVHLRESMHRIAHVGFTVSRCRSGPPEDNSEKTASQNYEKN